VPTLYVLDEDGRPRREPDLAVWARWMDLTGREMETTDGPVGRRLGHTRIDDEVRVSTLFLGEDRAMVPGGVPILFETMIFGGPYDCRQWRYPTRDLALRGHTAVVEALLLGHDPDDATWPV
jgi:hypothetical protein